MAERRRVSAIILVREAIDSRHGPQSRATKHAAIADYALEMTGASFDLDQALESAGIERLLMTDKKPE